MAYYTPRDLAREMFPSLGDLQNEWVTIRKREAAA